MGLCRKVLFRMLKTRLYWDLNSPPCDPKLEAITARSHFLTNTTLTCDFRYFNYIHDINFDSRLIRLYMNSTELQTES